MECQPRIWWNRCSNNPGFWSKQADSEAKDCSKRSLKASGFSLFHAGVPCMLENGTKNSCSPHFLSENYQICVGIQPSLSTNLQDSDSQNGRTVASVFHRFSPLVQMCYPTAGRKMSPHSNQMGLPTGRERKNHQLIELDQKMAHSWIKYTLAKNSCIKMSC